MEIKRFLKTQQRVETGENPVLYRNCIFSSPGDRVRNTETAVIVTISTGHGISYIIIPH